MIMLEKFNKFALRRNVVDLAIRVIIGGGLRGHCRFPRRRHYHADHRCSHLDFSNYYVRVSSKVQAGLSYADAKKAGAVLGYGEFITEAC